MSGTCRAAIDESLEYRDYLKRRKNDSFFDEVESMFTELDDAIWHRRSNKAQTILDCRLFRCVAKWHNPEKAIRATLIKIIRAELVDLLAHILDWGCIAAGTGRIPRRRQGVGYCFYPLAGRFREALVRPVEGNAILTYILKPYHGPRSETGESVKILRIVLGCAREYDGPLWRFPSWRSGFLPSQTSPTLQRERSEAIQEIGRRSHLRPSPYWLVNSPMVFYAWKGPSKKSSKSGRKNLKAKWKTPLQWALVEGFLPEIADLLVSEGGDLSIKAGSARHLTIRDHIFLPANARSADIPDALFDRFLRKLWQADAVNLPNMRGRLTEWIRSLDYAVRDAIDPGARDQAWPVYVDYSSRNREEFAFSRVRLVHSGKYLHHQILACFGGGGIPGDIRQLSEESERFLEVLEEKETEQRRGRQRGRQRQQGSARARESETDATGGSTMESATISTSTE